MKLLFVAPWVPSSMRPRSLGLLERLALTSEVIAVCQTWSARDSEALRSLRKNPAFKRVEFVEVSERRIQAVMRAGRSLLAGGSLQAAYVHSLRVQEAVDRAYVEFSPDVIYYNVLRGVVTDRAHWSVVRVVDLDEFRSQYFGQVSRLAAAPTWRLIGHLEAIRQEAAEREIVRRFDRVLVSSPRDLAGRPPNVRLVRSPHFMTPFSSEPRSESQGPTLTMVGRFSYRANHEAAVWFIRNVMPLVWRREPLAVLRLVGAEPKTALRRLAGPSVEVVGTVPAVDPYYRSAWVNVVPVNTATGVQMKLIEAAALGVPSVVSPVVALGAGVEHGVQALVADSSEDWAREIERLLADRAMRARLGAAASEWASRFHGPAAVSRQFLDALDGISSTSAWGPS